MRKIVAAGATPQPATTSGSTATATGAKTPSSKGESSQSTAGSAARKTRETPRSR